MNKYYRVIYTLLVYGRKQFFQSNKIKAFCKLHALLKFVIKTKHSKNLNRKILKVEKIKWNQFY